MNKIVSNRHKYIISRDTKWYTYQFDHIIDDYMIGFDIYHQTVVYMINLITGMQNWDAPVIRVKQYPNCKTRWHDRKTKKLTCKLTSKFESISIQPMLD